MSKKFTIMVAVEFNGIDADDVDAQNILFQKVNIATEDLYHGLQKMLPAHIRDLVEVSVKE
jgi:hypothetical protein